MRITVNGQPHILTPGLKVSQLLAQLQLEPRRVAVERNRQLVPRAQFNDTTLLDGDAVEIVSFVGGG